MCPGIRILWLLCFCYCLFSSTYFQTKSTSGKLLQCISTWYCANEILSRTVTVITQTFLASSQSARRKIVIIIPLRLLIGNFRAGCVIGRLFEQWPATLSRSSPSESIITLKISMSIQVHIGKCAYNVKILQPLCSLISDNPMALFCEFGLHLH